MMRDKRLVREERKQRDSDSNIRMKNSPLHNYEYDENLNLIILIIINLIIKRSGLVGIVVACYVGAL